MSTLEARVKKLEAGRLLARDPFAHLTGEQAAKIAREFLLGEAAQKEPDPTNEYFQLTMLEQLDTDETKPIWMLACVVCDGLRHALE